MQYISKIATLCLAFHVIQSVWDDDRNTRPQHLGLAPKSGTVLISPCTSFPHLH